MDDRPLNYFRVSFGFLMMVYGMVGFVIILRFFIEGLSKMMSLVRANALIQTTDQIYDSISISHIVMNCWVSLLMQLRA